MVHTRRQSRKAAKEATLKLQSSPAQDSASVAGKHAYNNGASTASVISPKKQAERYSSCRNSSFLPSLHVPGSFSGTENLHIEKANPSQKTPSRRELKPSSEEMHPQHFRSQNPEERGTTATKLKPAWFLEVNDHTKGNDQTSEVEHSGLIGKRPSTPTQSSFNDEQMQIALTPWPGKQLGFSKPPPSFQCFAELDLSPEAKKIMAENQASAKIVLAKMKSESNLRANIADSGIITESRSTAKPKGRFSDVHEASFKKMDSIANHPSSWRAVRSPVKKSTMSGPKAALLTSTAAPILKPHQKPLGEVKRPTFRNEAGSDDDLPSAKRVRRAIGDDAATSRPNAVDDDNNSTRSKAAKPVIKSHLWSPTKSSLARSQSVRNLKSPGKSIISKMPSPLRPNSTTDLLAGFGGAAAGKFGFQVPPLKTSKFDSRSQFSGPAKSASGKLQEAIANWTPRASDKQLVNDHSHSPQIFNKETKSREKGNLATPSKNKPLPTLPVTPSASRGIKTGIPVSLKIKSILRTPKRLYSNDPEKIASGTHLATPPQGSNTPQTPQKQISRQVVPATAPPAANKAVKHVGFTESVILKALKDEAKATSVEPEPSYPDLSSFLSGFRRKTLIGPAAQASAVSISSPVRARDYNPSEFTFRMGNEITFGTIHPVRASDAQLPAHVSEASASKKRKAEEALYLDILDPEASEKENEEGDRPTKKQKLVSTIQSFKAKDQATQGRSPLAHSPVRKLAKRSSSQEVESAFGIKKGVTTGMTDGTKGVRGLSASRLAFLAQPKRR